MKGRIFKMVLALHKSTLPPDLQSKRDKGYRALSLRLFKQEQYIKHVSAEAWLPDDITIKVLVVAYIKGMRQIRKDMESKFADINDHIPWDYKFYLGIWNIISSECSIGNVVYPEFTMPSESEISNLKWDPEVSGFTIDGASRQVIASHIVYDGPIKSINAMSSALGYHVHWLKAHIQQRTRENRPVPMEKVLRFMFNVQHLNNQGVLGPTPDFWKRISIVAWKYVILYLEPELEAAEEVRKRKISEDAGIDRKPNKITLKGRSAKRPK